MDVAVEESRPDFRRILSEVVFSAVRRSSERLARKAVAHVWRSNLDRTVIQPGDKAEGEGSEDIANFDGRVLSLPECAGIYPQGSIPLPFSIFWLIDSSSF